ncbi:MAG: hypothetical protein AB7H90_11005 [Alphaproteobacteria bacterium]
MPSTAPVSAQSRRFARLAVLIACAAAVAGCTGAVETWRSVRGVNKNDPDQATAPFSGNMATAEAAPYPNLASVPPPPTRATTAAERQKLTEKLIAERAAAVGASAGISAAPQPVAAIKAAPAAAPGSPPISTRLAAAAPAAVSGPPPASVPPATAAAPPIAETAATPVLPAATTQTTQTRVAAAGETPGSQLGAAGGDPAQALPRDSELRMPQVRSLPEPDDPRPAPPPPRLRPVPPPAPAQLPPAAIASAAPQPPPSVPQLAPIASPPTPGIANPALAKTEPPRPPATMTVAMLDAVEPGQLDPAQITRIAARYKERLDAQPPLRAVRVIAYTAPPSPGADPLGGYHDALQRAQGIAKVLAEAGIPAKMIQTEAKPAPGPIAASRVEIQFLP